jgi:PAS domain S-box-containing protein
MVQLDVTHLVTLALGALSGAVALWAHRRGGTTAAQVASSCGSEDTLRAELKLAIEHERMLAERLNLATEAANISCWEVDIKAGRFVWIENPLPEIFGDTAPSLEYYLQQMHPDDRIDIETRINHAIDTRLERISYRYRISGRSGTLLHMQTHARLLLSPSGDLHLLGVSWDATHEFEAATKLEQQARHERTLRDRLSMSTQAAGITCWEMDLDRQRVVVVDQNVRGLHLLSNFDGSVEEFFSHVHLDDRDIFVSALKHTLQARHDHFSCRYRVLGSDGNPIHIQTHARIVCDETGGKRLFGVSWDITNEIAAAERLRQQARVLRDVERRLERASLSSSEGHWEKDLEHNRMWYSSSYHALLGFADGELSRSLSDAAQRVHPEDVERVTRDLRQHVDDGKTFDTPMRLLMKTGEYRWFRHRGMAERDGHGCPRRISGSIQDIHEQKLAEDALRYTQQRFERAINGTQDGLWEMDADGSSWHSPRVEELLGYEPGQLPIGSNFLKEFLHPNDADAIAAATRVHFQDSLPYDVEIRLRTRSGEYRWYRARATAERDPNGRPLRLSGSLQDVTDARSAREALLRATEAAESANRAKSEFLANVSHEIRTPMNGIIGMTGLLLESPLSRTQRDYADTIRSSADSLLIVINDILDFSKIEAGKLDIEALELSLRDTVEEAAVMLAFHAAAKNLELVVHIHPDVPERVVGDPQRIRQCLINLVSNAIKFTRAGEIVIEVSNVDPRDSLSHSRFEVRDTGIGIASGTLQNLFQPFVQADSSTTRHFGGTGLGLSIVRRLVQMMGGEVGADSELNKGSRFWFTLPLPAAIQLSPSPPPPLDLTRLGRRVLVVDDNETNRRVLAGQLMHAGFEVSLAAGGIEAMSLLHQAAVDGQPFEVALVDHRMHDMDGATLGERINADAKLSQARLVMLTSVDGQGDIHRFASLGFAAYLTKPIRTRELLECLDRVLAHDSKQWHMQSQPIVTRNTLGAYDAHCYRGLVLLVEDNAVNQKVAVRFLERMGCTVRVADNGVEAVRVCEDTTFDLILMDLQMPLMDGITATMRIRERETGDGRPHAPIVALTANAMASQLERCMEAGMDAFLTKPLEIPRLHETLTKFGLRVGPEETIVTSANAGVPVNLARLNELTDGEPEFTRELIATFIESGEQALHEARVALAGLDRVSLSRIAHKLKGASANIHAEPLRDLSHTLETQASSLDQPRLNELVMRLAVELDRAAQFLNQCAPPLASKAG